MDQIIKNKLVQLEKTSEKYWNIPPESGNLLNFIIKAANYKNVIEVGTSNGYSAIWLAEAVRKTGGQVFCIEHSEERIVLAKDNLEDCKLSDYITINQGEALKALVSDNIPDVVDLAFIDANKAEYIKYFKILDSKLKQGGIIAADNITSHQRQMQTFLDEINNNPNYQISYFPFGGGLILALKN